MWQEQKGSGSCSYICHQKKTNQETDTKLITRSGTHSHTHTVGLRTHLGVRRRVRFLKERPYFGFDALPAVEITSLVAGLETELLHNVLLGRFVGVQVETIESLQSLLSVAVCCVRHPAAWLHLRPYQHIHQFHQLNPLINQWRVVPAHVHRASCGVVHRTSDARSTTCGWII